MKKITIIGGCGVIGRLLTEGLSKEYDITIIDMSTCHLDVKYQQADATDEKALLHAIPNDTDVLIHLLNMKLKHDVMDGEEFMKMNDVFLKSTYYMYRAASELGIQKVIFASSNHVTDRYEKDGHSLLRREITTEDVPSSKSVYGILKFASEQLGYLFHEREHISVINLRIGTVVTDELDELHEKDRTKRTLLSHEDLLAITKAAIESEVLFGTYYAVSDNLNKPWSTEKAKRELGYAPYKSTDELLEEHDET
ncbi:NAD-dependent epimerase/dehydratase family protein [Bacillus sp. NPDC077027]|uniref:NAD-dependent epimerase/dehydratase family protein n=1 Tax=Bacillus sp. NPDC077027 TaxID=3390548 RepID=UPI003D03FE1B